MPINPSKRVHAECECRTTDYCNFVLELTAFKSLTQTKKIKPLIATGQRTQERSSVRCRSVPGLPLPAIVTVWLAPYHVRHGTRKKHECLLELFRVNLNKYLRNKMHYPNSRPLYITPAVISFIMGINSPFKTR